MTRRRSNPQPQKKKTSIIQQKTTVYLSIIVVIIIASGAIIAFQSTQQPNQNDQNNQDQPPTTNDGTWLFAMDTYSEYVGGKSAYNTGYIPTLVIIDVEGRIVHKSAGVHTKQDLENYVNQAEQSSPSRETAPDFTLTTLNGNQFKLSDYQGTPVILDIMAVRCPPCHQQMPELQKLKQDLGDEVTILSIDIDGASGSETADDVRNAFGEYIKQ